MSWKKLARFLRERPRICVHGPGGVGKTALSAAALEMVAPSRTQSGPFTGGIYSHDFYLAPTLEQSLGSVLIQAGKGDLPEDQRPDAVHALLARPGVALYLEGCERTEHLDALLALAPGCRVLYTTRNPPHDPHHAALEVKPFGLDDAIRVLQSYAL